MAYRNKTYVCFDADSDIRFYNLMKAWKENGTHPFNFHNAHDLNNLRQNTSDEQIYKKLLERLKNTKVMIVLIGGKTKNLYKFVRWEIEYAIDTDLPIIAVNLNKKNKMDNELCPPILKDKLAIHVPFYQSNINYALNYWPDEHYKNKKDGKSGPFYYEE